jgi:hypothetical protein
MTLAPNPLYPERVGQAFEVALAYNVPNNRGDMRFEEGIGTDTDVPNDFVRGAYIDTQPRAGTLNQKDPEHVWKHADETMAERAHIGSSTWIEAPAMLSDFVAGAGAGQTPPQYEMIRVPGGYAYRRAPTVISD